MSTSSRDNYFDSLRRELNPTVFETEWLGLRIEDVKLCLGSSASTVKQCISTAREIIEARKHDAAQFEHMVEESSAPEELKKALLLVWREGGDIEKVENLDSLAMLAIFCFLHVAFSYKRNDI